MPSPAPGAPASGPRLLALDECAGEAVGGKALGLARLAARGLPVPPTLVLLGLGDGPLPEEAVQRCLSLGEPLAVRSSAQDEDGAGASFAGQFESRLGVRGPAALREAVDACVAAAGGAVVAEYRRELAGAGAGAAMALVVQRMIEPRAAGVLFTADPVSGDRGQMVVSATAGLGEALLAGHSAADEYALGADGALRSARPAGAAPVLGAAELAALHGGARAAEAGFGCPLDLEWAFDQGGALYWLQARPITTLDGPGLGELDTPVRDPREIYTRCNVGEMLPGAVTPLTLAVFGQAIEDAFIEMGRRSGIPPHEGPGRRYIYNFSGHLFFNLSALHAYEGYILGAKRRDVDISVVGRVLDGGPPLSPGPLHLRARNGLRYARALRGAWDEVCAVEARVKAARIEDRGDARERLRRIDEALPLFSEVSTAHLLCSGASGALLGVIMGVLSGGAAPTPKEQAIAAALLRDIPGIESAEMAAELQAVAARVAEAGAGVAALPPGEALAWLRGPAAGAAGEAFARFLSSHGHRCVREAELRQRDWGEDPLSLVEAVQTALRGVAGAAQRRGASPSAAEVERSIAAALAPLPLPARLILRRVVPWARQAVARRERSKSIFVRYVSLLKRAYRGLGAALQSEGRLPDPDLLYFLQPAELAELVAAERPELGRRALRRRRLLGQQARLLFPDVAVGAPAPLVLDLGAAQASGEALRGVPVCQGVVVGPARVARTPAEAAGLQPGEILVVPHTDVGWTPFYGVAAGLATDTGSPLSHGAVVAREHGLPSVVNLRTATHRFRTGERVVLDGAAGTLAPAAE